MAAPSLFTFEPTFTHVHDAPIDPSLSAEQLLVIVQRLYRALRAAPRDEQPARIREIRGYADRYNQVEAHG